MRMYIITNIIQGAQGLAMFEAFRYRPPASSTEAPAPAAAASKPATPSKRKRQGSSGDGLAAGAAAAAAAAGSPGQQGGRGLALEKLGDLPLRLIIVGHNPSQHAWSSGHFYSNGSNWMWRILRDTGIAPPATIRGHEDDGLMPAVAGVGFTDVGSGTPGTDSAQFTSQHFAAWRPGFYARLAKQAQRASAAVPGCTCGTCGAPLLVAFSGKRQFTELFPQPAGAKGRGGPGGKAREAGGEAPPQATATGRAPTEEACSAVGTAGGGSSLQGAGEDVPRVPSLQSRRPGSVPTGRQSVLPEGWPLPLSTEVWVMTSTSGAAPMTREQRYAPWQALAERLQQEPWPRQCAARCSSGGAGSTSNPRPG